MEGAPQGDRFAALGYAFATANPVPEPNRTYFMIFGNPNRLVKPGGRVSVVIGNFHVEGLTVD